MTPCHTAWYTAPMVTTTASTLLPDPTGPQPQRRRHQQVNPLLLQPPDADCQQQLLVLRQTITELQEALARERDINIAVGILMVQHRLHRRDAFEQLRQTARRRRHKLVRLASEVVTAAEALALGGR